MFRSHRARYPIALCLEMLEDRVTPTALPTGFTESLLAAGIPAPTAMDFAPDGRLFVAEQTGQLRIVKNGQLLPTAFVSLSVDSSGERGLLGIAFDPNFALNQSVYLYYTVPGSPAHNRVSRFIANGDLAVPGSETPILDLDSLSNATNHNGGAIHFGPDGKLYVGVGENANGSNAQTLSNRLGKLLRIDPDGSIPADNPFNAQAVGANRSIWARGLRNPFTFAFQPGSGRLFINDVGASTWEEVEDGIAGSNYGWPITEGPTLDPRFRGPIFAYGHGTGHTLGVAITGGTFYNPATNEFPTAYAGDYFFADLGNGWIRRLHPADDTVSLFATGLASLPVGLEVGPEGSLYYLSHGAGGVYRIDYAPPRLAVAQTASGALVTFAVTATNALYRHDEASGWTKLGDPGTVRSIAAVTETSANVVAFVVTSDHALYRHDSLSGWLRLGAPGTVDWASAGTAPDGRADVFVLTTGDSLFRYDASGWAALGAPRSILSMTAADRGRVVAVGLDRSVLTYDLQVGWTSLGGADFAQSAEAATDAGDNLVVFTVGTDGSLARRDSSGWTPLGAPGTILSASAGTDSAGRVNVFALASGSTFFEYSATSGWGQLASPGTVRLAIAADRDRVLAVYANGSLQEHEDPFGWFALTGPGFV